MIITVIPLRSQHFSDLFRKETTLDFVRLENEADRKLVMLHMRGGILRLPAGPAAQSSHIATRFTFWVNILVFGNLNGFNRIVQ